MDKQRRAAYQKALQEASVELAGHTKRGEDLRAAVEGLKSLLAVPEPPKQRRRQTVRRVGGVKASPSKPTKKKTAAKKSATRRRRRGAGAGHPQVAPDAYADMGPTTAYRRFLEQHGKNYTVPQIRDALLQGGVKSKSNTALLTGLHAAIRRDKKKTE